MSSDWAAKKAEEILGQSDVPLVAWLARDIATALRDAARVPEGCVRTADGVDRKVLGTLPITADGYVAGFPPGYGSLFGRGRHVPIDRFDPVCMWYDNASRCVMVRVNGVHGGLEFDGMPIGCLYSTREAAEAARGEVK